MSRTATTVSAKEGYERWAATYDSDQNPLLARESRYLRSAIAHLPAKRILDLACGTGRWISYLADKAAFVVGLDNSAPMLEVACNRSPRSKLLAHGDCERLPFCDGAFDFAICSFALGHIAGMTAMAEELARVLQPTANLFISDLHPEAFTRGWRVGFRDGDAVLEIETSPRGIEETQQSFCRAGFQCLAQQSLQLGEAERPIFERAKKSTYFAEACQVPAVIVLHFLRTYSIATSGTRRS